MSVTMKQVRAILDPEEPNYVDAAKLGTAAIPHLEALVRTAEPMLASKATYLASLIMSEGSERVVRTAAESAEPIVRVAAAAATRNLNTEAVARMMPILKADRDAGVRKVAERVFAQEDDEPTPEAATVTRRQTPIGAAEETTGAAGEGGGSIDGLGNAVPEAVKPASKAKRGAATDAPDSSGGEGGGSVDGSSSFAGTRATLHPEAATAGSNTDDGEGGGDFAGMAGHSGHVHDADDMPSGFIVNGATPSLFGGGQY